MIETDIKTFFIFVDRVEGNFAICEMPDGTMCDVELSCFNVFPKDRERFEAYIDSKGNIKILKKYRPEIPDDTKRRLSVKLVRFT